MKISSLPEPIYKAACQFGLLELRTKFFYKKITDGVSSDIYYIKTENNKEFCIKRALRKLAVKEDWFAPINRSNFEAEYFKECKKIIPSSFPKLLGHDSKKYILALEWFKPEQYSLWKKKLLNNKINVNDATQVSKILNKKHAFFFNKKNYEKKFSNDKTFHDIRIEPYILFTSQSYPEYKNKFLQAADNLMLNKKTLIHGDFSPKNILTGRNSAVILDAETACWGDPAFDLAFCNNHIILKSFLNPKIKNKYINLSKQFITNYIDNLNWDEKDLFTKRFFQLLPLLILARVDGKSPVEYFTEKEKVITRSFALEILNKNQCNINNFISTWDKYVKK